MLVNKIIQEGDSFRILAKPMVGITGVASFTEVVTGSTGTWLTRQFKYSVDGVNFTDLAALTNPALSSLVFTVGQFVVFEFLYQRSSGSDRTVTSLTIAESYGTLPWENTYFDKSNYKVYFEQNDTELLNWTYNVLNKVYRIDGGVIPTYISRKDDVDSDKSFIEFWLSICYFCALDVKLARIVSEYYNNDLLLKFYLENRGLFVSKKSTLLSMQYLQSTYYHQMFNRGTNHIVDSEINDGDEVDGELPRLLSNSEHDELAFCFHKKEHFGWNLRNSSPTYRGLGVNKNSNKIIQSGTWVRVDSSLSYNFSFNIKCRLGVRQVFTGLVQGAPVTGSGTAHVRITAAVLSGSPVDYYVPVLIGDGAQDVTTKIMAYLQADVDFNDVFTTSLTPGYVLLITHREPLDDDITAACLIENGTCLGLTPNTTGTYINGQEGDLIKVEIQGKDRYGTTVSLKQRHDGSFSNIALNNIDTQRSNKTFNIRIGVYKFDEPYDVLDTTNINKGHNLILSQDIGYIRPIVYINNTPTVISESDTPVFTSPSLYTSSVYFGVMNTPFSHGLLQVPNFISAFLRNQSTYDFETIKKYVRRFLIPYNSTISCIEINSVYLDPDNPLNSYYATGYVDAGYVTPQV